MVIAEGDVGSCTRDSVALLMVSVWLSSRCVWGVCRGDIETCVTVSAGGLDDVNCYRTVERYDPQSDEWTEVCSLRSPRGGGGVAPLGKYLYAAGGNDGSASLQTVER